MIYIFRSAKLCYEYMRFDEASPKALALYDVDIDISQGEFVAVLGHNGSGKSTLARHLNALLTPTGGTLWIKGMDSKEQENVWQIRRLSGMVFQNPDNQLVATIVEEDVAFGPENLGVPSEEIRERVASALKSVGMTKFAESAPHQLSGGQKQRVAIAGILAMKPMCIVLDEPTAMLDPSGRDEVMGTITLLNKEHGITVVLITHFMEEAVRADRVIVLDKGQIVMDGSPKEVFRQVEKVMDLGLDVPPVTALAHKLTKLGIPISTDILTGSEFASSFMEIMSDKGS